MWDRLKFFINPFDARYEDLRKGPWQMVVLRDFSAGLIVAMMAIPLAMGFAMASGLKPEQGIVGGAVAGLVGALFGGSKYQVYGPTAAFIPVIYGLMAAYATPDDPYAGHGFLVLAAIISGIVLMLMGVTGLGKIVRFVPHSIVVGFTIGIAVTIALSQIGEVLGLPAFEIKDKSVAGLRAKDVPETVLQKIEPLKDTAFQTRKDLSKKLESLLSKEELQQFQNPVMYHAAPNSFLDKLHVIQQNIGKFNGLALLLAIVTFLITQYLLKISTYIPAPLIAVGVGIWLSGTLQDGSELMIVAKKFGDIPTDFFVFTAPVLPKMTLGVLLDLVRFVAVIVFVSGVESLLCSRMADRLADNQGTPFNPNKEFWGQGMVQILVPLLNGFPHTGALARTATNIKVGAITPLAGICKAVLKLLLAFFLASYLGLVPMACIGGILIWVAFNMVKPAEIKQVLAHNWFHVLLMIVTAGMVIVTDFMTGVVSGMIVYAVLFKFLDRPTTSAGEHEKLLPASEINEKNGQPVAGTPAPAGASLSETR